MATERQIVANRQNARKSTGPRSHAGRKRASRNSYRHGLCSGVAAAAECAKHVEALAQKIAGRGPDAVTIEIARSVARAEFELAQIRRVKVALIARMSEFGEFEVWRISIKEEIRRCGRALKRGDPIFALSPALSAPEMPSVESERTAEAVRRALPELVKLDRYERRASARRDRASRQIVARRMLLDNL
jgi:hypothetical protein